MGLSARISPVVNETASQAQLWSERASYGALGIPQSYPEGRNTHTHMHAREKVIDHHEGWFAEVRQREEGRDPSVSRGEYGG